MEASITKAELTKKLIATKAKEVFIQKGYFQASMEIIRIHSGMSKGSIYYHFKSKEELFIYILELYLQDWIDKWNDKCSKLTTAKDKLVALAEHYALDFESPLMRAATEFSGSEAANPKIKEKLLELNNTYVPIVRDIIEEGMTNNEFKRMDVMNTALITFGFLAGVGAVCQNFGSEDIPEMYRTAVDIYMKGLGR